MSRDIEPEGSAKIRIFAGGSLGGRNMGRFSSFTDHEIYILRRQAIEASCQIIFSSSKDYSADDLRMHEQLLNEISTECCKRDILQDEP